MSFTTTYNGLEIDYSVEEYSPAVMYLSNGDPGYPAEGGCCDGWEIVGIDDIDELFEFIGIEIEDQDPSWLQRKMFRVLRWCVEEERWETLPAKQQGMLTRRFARFAQRFWSSEIEEHCTAHYWDEIGGPDGEADYFSDF